MSLPWGGGREGTLCRQIPAGAPDAQRLQPGGSALITSLPTPPASVESANQRCSRAPRRRSHANSSGVRAWGRVTMATFSPVELPGAAPRSLGLQDPTGPTGGGSPLLRLPARRAQREVAVHTAPPLAGAPGLGGKKAAHPAIARALEGTVYADRFSQQPLTPPANVFPAARSREPWLGRATRAPAALARRRGSLRGPGAHTCKSSQRGASGSRLGPR